MAIILRININDARLLFRFLKADNRFKITMKTGN